MAFDFKKEYKEFYMPKSMFRRLIILLSEGKGIRILRMASTNRQ